MSNYDVKATVGTLKELPKISEFSERTTQSVNWENGLTFKIVDFGVAYFQRTDSGGIKPFVIYGKDADDVRKEKQTQIDEFANSDDYVGGGFCFATDKNKNLYLSQISRYQIYDAVNPKTDETKEITLKGELVDMWREETCNQLEFIQKVLDKYADTLFKVERTPSYYYYDEKGRLRTKSAAQFVVAK